MLHQFRAFPSSHSAVSGDGWAGLIRSINSCVFLIMLTGGLSELVTFCRWCVAVINLFITLIVFRKLSISVLFVCVWVCVLWWLTLLTCVCLFCGLFGLWSDLGGRCWNCCFLQCPSLLGRWSVLSGCCLAL